MDQDNSDYEQLANPLQGIVDGVIDSIIISLSAVLPKLSFLWQFLNLFKGVAGLFVVSLLLLIIVLLSMGSVTSTGGSVGTRQSVLYAGLPSNLSDFVFPGFQDTGFPQGSPLGGRGYEWSKKTAGFYELEYYNIYGNWHQGLDLVPNQQYYTDNPAYLLAETVLVFATCSGFAQSKVDQYGALYVIILCRDGQQVWYAHNSTNYIPKEGTEIRSGQPVGIMGNTGLSDGSSKYRIY